ncbi:MAG: prepilin-type N-terminal cleavage/methylation domain-containing protein [Alphaproteobacteria bacterium]|nr:prepilin-type N-terminal cleavage/methylation domain-containing protein [Alphaproteobacteria bacterium]MCB9984937.1 prepilin-type N-terminal cleavage/methylation domain-containing protein [Micavibrio sp.]HPQ50115.1 prepilin-type N-terminal cleavage/methylation domain-containing protein [Alphaproteobacteria bacterium]
MKKSIPTTNKSLGFTLIELAIVIIIAGLLAAPLIQAYSLYYQNQFRTKTISNIDMAKEQIAFYFNNTIHYPCPADRAVSANDINFGTAFDANCDPSTVGLTTPNTCTADGGICLVQGNVDLSIPLDGDTTDPNELVIIGAIPIKTIRDTNSYKISNEVALDAWGRKLTYAVSLGLTNSSTYKFNGGQIRAIDEYGSDTAGINGNAHYAVVSHGRDGKGAFNRESNTKFPCTTGQVDSENCDDDSVFSSAIGHYEANTASFFDDFSYFMINNSSSLWAFIPSTGHIYNLNNGNIGIRTGTPTEKLDVSGTLKASNNLKAAKICKKTGSSGCFNIESITGDTADFRCPTGQVLVGISNSAADCQVPAFTPPINFDCSPNWIHGIDSKGCVICTDGKKHC